MAIHPHVCPHIQVRFQFRLLSKTQLEHTEQCKQLEEQAETAEAERIFIELELNNARAERDLAEANTKQLIDKYEQGASPLLQVPIASVSDFAPNDLSQKLKAAHKEVRTIFCLQEIC
jgi:hypothetical protein